MNEINEIENINAISNEPSLVEIEVKRNGQVIYKKMALAGVFCVVEQITDYNPRTTTFEGVTQNFAWGNPVALIYALDQQKQKLAKSPLFHLGMQQIRRLVNLPREEARKFIEGLNEVLHLER